MAGTKVRGITIELSADASGINKELQNVNKSISSTGRELKDIDKLLKLDPSNTQLLAQKQEALARQIENTRDKVDLLRKAEEDLKSQMVDGGTEEQKKQLAALQREIISTERSLDNYESQLDQTGKETRDLTKAEQQAERATGDLGDGFTVLKGALASLVADGIRKAIDGFKDLMTAGPEFADEILTMAKTTSLATDTLQELSYMSDLVDVDVTTVAGSLKKLTKTMSSAKDGSGSAADAFSKLGVSVTDAQGNLRDNEDVFYDTIDALGKMQNETERDAVAMKLFGKNATELNPMIEAGADQLKAFAEEAHEMGYVLDEDALGALGRVQDEFDRFGKQMEAVKNQIASGVAPAIERGMKKLSAAVNRIDWRAFGEKVGKAFDKLIDALEWIIKNWKTVATGLSAIVAAMAVSKIKAAVTGFQSLVTTLKSLWGVIAANPMTAFIGLIVAAGAALMIWQKSLADSAREADAGWQATDRLTQAASEQVAVVNEMVTAYNDMQEAREATLNAGMAEMAHVESLKAELDTLADANGVVAESDQARAQFILNELNNALGTEYTMTGNVISQYADLSAAIDDVIAKKKAEVVLAAQEDAYREAITKRADAERALTDVVTKENEIKRQVADNEARMQELMSATGPQLAANAKEIGDLAQQNIALNGSLDELGTKHQEAAELVNKYAYDIKSYEDNMTKSLQGNYKDLKYESYETAKAMGRDMDDYAAKVEKDAGAAARDFASLKEKIRETAKNIGQGVADGINEGAGPAYTAMSAFGNNLLTKFKQTMEIKSPSKKMQENAKFMVDGVVTGIKNNEKNAIAAVGEMGNRMSDAFKSSFTIGSALNGSNLSLLNARHLADVANASSTSNFTQNIYAPAQPSRIELYRQTRNLLAAAGRL